MDFLAEAKGAVVVPIEVKSGKSYKLHVALNNLLGAEGYDVEYAYVLSEANVSIGCQAGKPVYYLPFYMLPFITSEFVADVDAEAEIDRIKADRASFFIKPP